MHSSFNNTLLKTTTNCGYLFQENNNSSHKNFKNLSKNFVLRTFLLKAVSRNIDLPAKKPKDLNLQSSNTNSSILQRSKIPFSLKKTSLRTGAYILIDQLIQNGVEHIFGYPGGAILPIYDELYHWEKANLIKHILVRHEQSAVHAADSYSRATNRVGVCFATSGPGATNLVTGIANAKMDSIPLIVITGQVGRSFIGTDAFQETDIFGITLPIVKHSYTVRDTSLLPKILTEAFFLAQNGRPGPVLIDIPKDVGLEEVPLDKISYWYPKLKELFEKTNYRTEHSTNLSTLTKVISYLSETYQPLFYLGGGILRSNSFKIIQQLSKLYQIPNTTTLMGKSCSNENDYLSLGMLGMHGTAYANFAVSECDLLIALGARFDDRVTGKLEEFACEAEVIHIDIDPAEISKNRCPQLSIIGDNRKVLLQLLKRLKKVSKVLTVFESNNEITSQVLQTESWLKRISKWKELYPLVVKNYSKSKNYEWEKEETIALTPQETISFLGKQYPNAFFTTDVGQHQMWSAQLINCQPKKWISSSGLGTMGFGLPAAIGAQVANPQQDVICISGDSSFQMSIQELGTISQYQLNIKIIIINNGWQGMVRQWQEAFYGNRFSNSYMRNGMPNFAQVANAYSIESATISSFLELKTLPFLANTSSTPLRISPYSLSKSSSINFHHLGPFLVDVNVMEKENCYPMVAPGRSNSQMLGLEKTNLSSLSILNNQNIQNLEEKTKE